MWLAIPMIHFEISLKIQNGLLFFRFVVVVVLVVLQILYIFTLAVRDLLRGVAVTSRDYNAAFPYLLRLEDMLRQDLVHLECSHLF